MLGGSSSRSQGGGLLEAEATKPGGRRRRARLRLEELSAWGTFAKSQKQKVK